MNEKSDAIEFWETRYRAGRMPWDFGGVPRALTGWLHTATAPGRVLIPGCGSGYEVSAFHAAGWDVVAIEMKASDGRVMWRLRNENFRNHGELRFPEVTWIEDPARQPAKRVVIYAVEMAASPHPYADSQIRALTDLVERAISKLAAAREVVEHHLLVARVVRHALK